MWHAVKGGCGTLIAMARHLESPADLTNRLDFETLIADVSARLVSAPDDEFPTIVEEALGRVIRLFGADRGGILAVNPDRRSVHVVHAWYAETAIERVSGAINLAELFPYAYHLLAERRQPYIVSRYDDVPPEAAVDRATHAAMGVRSTFNIPIAIGTDLRYIMTIDALRQEMDWPASYVPRLQLLGEIFANAVERRRIDDALRGSEARLALATLCAGVGAWDLDMSTGRIWATPQTKALYGFPGEAEVTFDAFLAVVHSEDVDRVRDHLLDVVATASEFTDEYRVVLPGGEIRWVAARGRVLPETDAPPHRLMGISLDITGPKHAEAERHATVARLEAAMDVASLAFYEKIDRATTIFVDTRCRALFAIPGDYSVGDRIAEFWVGHLHPDDRRRILDIQEQLTDGRLDRALVEYRYLHPERGVTWLHHAEHVLRRHPDGQAQTTIGVVRDMTEDKRREEALRASEEVNRATFEQAAVGIAHVGTDGSWLRVNDRLCALLGHSREQLTGGMTSRDVTYPDDADADAESIHQVLAGQKAAYTVEKRYVTRDRGVIWANLTVSLVRNHAGHPKHFIAVVEDITDRKHAEETLAKALEEVQRLREQLERENTYLRQEVTNRKGRGRIVGQGEAIRHMLEAVEKVAPTSSTVLLLGETGTGKELVAEVIHSLSARHDRVMVRVNCAAIPVTLIESELFGRERGAYTGALSKQVGRFELASGSTIFLDEIGDLPINIQVKLLHVLQERQIERLGSPRSIPIDLRIIAATSRDLERDVLEGRFREDLFYRLNVFPVRVPPLRDRPEDLPLLVDALVGELAGLMGKRIESVSRTSLDALTGYSWPGNVRELRNAVERALILATGPVLEIEIPGVNQPGTSASSSPRGGAGHLDQAELLHVLQQTGWRIRGKRGAAALLGLKPTTLESRMARLGIKRP
jgi:formate hydrogenlyase transcriptional activator